MSFLGKGHAEGPWGQRETSRETARITEGTQYQKQLQQSEGEDNEVTITHYHCIALFVLLGTVRYDVCQHGCSDLRLASVAWSGT
jgi:hypothetical protein